MPLPNRHPRRPAPAPGPAARAGGFTLTEVLVVVVLIVLLLGLALPAFNVLTGSRSTEGASNQIAALLGRARNEAIGLQTPHGVLFYLDPATRRVAATIVRADVNGLGEVDGTSAYILDVVPDREALVLAEGVMVETLDDPADPRLPTTPVPPANDRYIGYNTACRTAPLSGPSVPTDIPYGGVILFDGQGRLVSREYAMVTRRNGNDTPMGRLLYPNTVPAPVASIVPAPPGGSPTLLRTSLGLALFDASTYATQFGGDAVATDAQILGNGYAAGTPSEQAEEKWIDDNALLLLVNRYNGTLLKGE